MINCLLNGVACEGLWDTGSMVSLLNSSWFRKHFPDVKIWNLTEFLEGDNLHLFAANNTPVEIEGVAVLQFSVDGSTPFPVPFLITQNELTQPIIGFNVIEYVVESGGVEMSKVLKKSFSVFPQPTVDAVVNVLQTSDLCVGDAKTTARTGGNSSSYQVSVEV